MCSLLTLRLRVLLFLLCFPLLTSRGLAASFSATLWASLSLLRLLLLLRDGVFKVLVTMTASLLKLRLLLRRGVSISVLPSSILSGGIEDISEGFTWM
jgi:hypothetical protein